MKKVAVVTGAAQGIGKAIAVELARAGWSVACLDRQLELAKATAIQIQASEGDAQGFFLDVAETQEFANCVGEIESQMGPIDTLVNAAGICLTRPFWDIDELTFQKTFDVNVKGVFFLMQVVAKKMMARKSGSIINLASVSAFIPKLEQLDYGASKAAIVSMTRSAALSLGPHGIRVNAIAPGVIDTPLTQQIAASRSAIRGVSAEETLRPVIDNLPLARIGTAQEVAQLARFLASEGASYITGQTIDVCGGQLMR